MKMFKTYKKNKGKKTIKIIHVNENYYKQNSHDNKKIPLQLASCCTQVDLITLPRSAPVPYLVLLKVK